MTIFRNIKRIVLYVLIFTATSCQPFNKTVYEEYQKFENLSWNRFDILSFSTDIENAETAYDILLNIRHLPQVKYEQLEVNMTIYTASGDMRSGDYTLYFYDPDGNRLSDCMGELCDLRTTLRKGFIFSEPGTVRIEIENKHTKVELPGIIEVGLLVREAEEEEEE